MMRDPYDRIRQQIRRANEQAEPLRKLRAENQLIVAGGWSLGYLEGKMAVLEELLPVDNTVNSG